MKRNIILFFFGLIPLAFMLTGCTEPERSAADDMPPVGAAEVSLVFDAVKIMDVLQVRSEGSRVDVVLNEQDLTENIYLTAARAICVDQMLKNVRFDAVGEVRVWNRGKYQGWAMLLPAKQCDEFAGSNNQDQNVLDIQKRKLTSDDISAF